MLDTIPIMTLFSHHLSLASSSFFPCSILCSINVSRNKDGALSRWCQTQRVRCKITLNRKGGVAAAGNVILSDNKSNPLTKEQFQLLEGIGFATSAKRKKYDSSVNDRKWEEKL